MLDGHQGELDRSRVSTGFSIATHVTGCTSVDAKLLIVQAYPEVLTSSDDKI